MTSTRFKELLKQARADLKARDFDAALAGVGQADEEEPNHPAVLRVQHDVHRASGDFEAALAAARTLIQFHPSKPWGYAKAAQNLIALRDYDGASAALDKALRRHPKDLDVLRVAAAFYRARGDRSAELEIAEALMAHHPDLPEGHCRAIQVHGASGDPDRALALLQEARESFPKHPDVLRAAHDLHQELGDHRAALEAALLLAESNPESPWGYVKAAQAHVVLGEAAEAKAHIDEALRRFPKDPEVLRGASNLYRSIGERRASLEAARWLIPHHADGYARAVQDLIKLHDSRAAEATLSEAQARFPGDLRVLRVTDDYLRSQGRHGEALEAVRRLIEVEQANPDGHLRAARCSRALGRAEDAKAHCEAARALLSDPASGSTKYVETTIRVYGVRAAARRLDPSPHNPGGQGEDRRQGYILVSGLRCSDLWFLGELLNLSGDVALFRELHPPHWPYARSSFEQDFVEAAYLRNEYRQENAAPLRKARAAPWIGDVGPQLYWRLSESLRHFEQDRVEVFHVVRPLSEVCALYQGLADDPAQMWSAFRDYRMAIDDFHIMCRSFLDRTHETLAPNHRITFVAQERLRRDPAYLLSLSRGLGLSDRDQLPARAARFIEEAERPEVPTGAFADQVRKEADPALIAEFEALSGCPCL